MLVSLKKLNPISECVLINVYWIHYTQTENRNLYWRFDSNYSIIARNTIYLIGPTIPYLCQSIRI